MEFQVSNNQGYLVISLSGRLDTSTAPGFEERCHALIDQGAARLILDFTELNYISSAGLRAILSSAKKVKKAKGGMSLCGLSGLALEVIIISAFDSFLPIYDNVDQAIKGGF